MMTSYAQYKVLKKNDKTKAPNQKKTTQLKVHTPEIEYDERGRMKYHPLYHPNQGKRFADEETAYLCKFYETDTLKSLSLALGRIEQSLEYKIVNLRKRDLIDYYKSKWDRQFK